MTKKEVRTKRVAEGFKGGKVPPIDSGEYYSGRITNDEHKAVEILDRFTKAFCIDATVKDDLVFRCKECSFSDGDNCRVKMFKCKFAPDYVDFGSMGDL